MQDTPTKKYTKATHDVDRDIARGNDIVTRLMGGAAIGGLVGGTSSFGTGLAAGAIIGGAVGVFVPSAIDSYLKRHKKL